MTKLQQRQLQFSTAAKNCAELLSKENVDGGLIGGASLKAADFNTIVQAAVEG